MIQYCSCLPYFSFAHATVDCSGTYIGQNIAYMAGSQINVTSMVDLWLAQEADYDYETNTCASECGYYTQIIWADTTEVMP